MFERYVNFEFYKRIAGLNGDQLLFERYVNFEFYKRALCHTVPPPRLRDM